MKNLRNTVIPLLIFTIFTSFIFLACSKKQKEHSSIPIPASQKLKIDEIEVIDKNVKQIDITDFKSEFSLSNITNVVYVKLESIRESLIGAIDKIICTDTRIYILDKTLSNNLFVFSKEGTFIAKIKNIGEGPNEIKQPYDFTVDETKNQIIVYDGVMNRIVYYDMLLKPIKQKKVFPRFLNFRKITENKFILAVGGLDNSYFGEVNNYQVLIVDSTFNIVKKGFKIEEEERKNDYALRENLHESDKNIIWAPKFKKQIFQFNANDKPELKYNLSFKSKEIPEENYLKPINELFKVTEDQNLYFYGGDFVENDSCIYMKLTTRLIKDQILIFVNKKNQEVVYGKLKIDNLDLPFFSFPISSYKNKFVTIIESNQIQALSKIENTKYVIPKNLVNISKSLKDGDNPIIQMYEIKMPKF